MSFISRIESSVAKLNDGRGVMGGVASSILVRIASAMTTLIAMPIALHTLGELRFGTFLLLFGIINWITLGSFGVHSALGRAIAVKEVGSAQQSVLLGGALIYAAISTFFMSAAVWGGYLVWCTYVGAKLNVPLREVTLAAEVMIVTVALQIVMQVFEGVRIGHLKLYSVNLARLAGSVFSFVCLIVLPRLWPSMVVFVIALNGGMLMGSLLNAGLVIRQVRPEFRKIGNEIHRLQALAVSGLAYFVMSIAALFQTHVPVLILASLYGPVSSIDFGLLIRLLFVMITGLGMLTTPLWPALLHARKEADSAWVSRSLRISAVLVFGAGAAFGTAVVFFGNTIVTIWTGRHLAEPATFQILFGVYFLQMAWSHYWATVLMGCGRERTVATVFILEAISMIYVGTILSAHYGPTGMILGQVMGFAFASNWMLPYFANREIHWSRRVSTAARHHALNARILRAHLGELKDSDL